MLKILSDRHHDSLWWSLQLLADRLRATLYCPYGLSWYDEGYYKLYGDLSKNDPYRYLAKKYLEDTIFTTNNTVGISLEKYNGCLDYPTLNLLTLEEAKKTNIDIVICSVNENEEPFLRLKEFYPNAKFVRQVGNDLDVNTIYPNLLASAKIPFNKFDGHKILYHQEFDLNLFKFKPIDYGRNIYSFQNDLDKFEEVWEKWNYLRHHLRNFNFRSYGRCCDDGNIYRKRTLINKMLEASFIFQSKGQWEGYGFNVHESMCLGRPMILKAKDYEGKIAEPLLIKDETYIEMDDPNLAEKIKAYSDPEKSRKMSAKCQEVFEKEVNFDKEFVFLKDFFDNLI